jgi:hypothetical protein
MEIFSQGKHMQKMRYIGNTSKLPKLKVGHKIRG